ncbi:unnamed protein product [Sympodiomycopsis kandeliae]
MLRGAASRLLGQNVIGHNDDDNNSTRPQSIEQTGDECESNGNKDECSEQIDDESNEQASWDSCAFKFPLRVRGLNEPKVALSIAQSALEKFQEEAIAQERQEIPPAVEATLFTRKSSAQRGESLLANRWRRSFELESWADAEAARRSIMPVAPVYVLRLLVQRPSRVDVVYERSRDPSSDLGIGRTRSNSPSIDYFD